MKNNSVIIENTAVKSESYNDPEFELKSNGSLSTQEIQCIHSFCNHYQLNLPLFLITASSVLYTRYHYEPESIIVNCNYRYPDHHLLSRNDQQQEFSISLVVSAIEDVFKLYHEIEKRVNLFKEIEKNEEVEKKQIISLSFSPESKSTSELEIDFEINKSINASFSCSKSSLLAPVIKNCGRHFVKLLHSVCSDPEKNIINLDLIDENEKVILRKWSDGIYEPSIAPKGCLHQLFEETVMKYPENPAVYFNGSVVRYAELNAKANQLARYLIDKGIRNGMFIGIDMQRTPDVYISMLGVLKAGATYIPIDPGFPKERVRYILNDCNAKFLLSNSIPGNISESINCPVINLYAISETLDQYPNHNLSPKESNVHSSNIAYSIYTSGTTGNPKGVKIPHAAVAHLVRAEGQLFGVTPADKVFQGFSVAFDASVEEIWMAFHSGAALFIGTEEMVQSGSNLSKVLNENNITVWSTVPTLLSMLNDDIPSLRLLILGGEVCSDELVKRWKTPRRRMVNTYGPTESTVIATVADCNIQQKVTIGRPIPNYSAYILDSNLQMVPEGVAGELCIGGLGLSEGYINMPELTQQKFITPQFDLNPEYPRRLYRSGDLCRFNNQGDIEFLGRIDSQVKLRGFRIELAEIESQLLLCPNVQSAAVAVKNGFNGIQLLVAFIIPADKKTFDAEGIKAQLKTKLAPYMMPNVFQLIHEMPLMPSGKVNRAKLPDPDYTSESGSVKETEECTPTEHKILQLWQKLFAPNPVELTDNFFNMGGHSLFASQMISELRKSPQMSKLSVRDVYTYPTVKELAGYVDKINAAKQGQEASKSKTEQNTKVNLLTYYTVAFLQIISILFFYGIASMFAISPFIVKHYDTDVTYPQLALYCTLGMLLAYPLFLFL
ncbi:MAG: non-ribosomal peptide synthetase, partial [Bacteroidota bacterium]|nr:non-ribosomal peptide synthetase [Bacteroidota bacterium]